MKYLPKGSVEPRKFPTVESCVYARGVSAIEKFPS